MKKYILSLYFGHHDSCITLANDEKVLLHLEAERYFRKKHIHLNADQMLELINYALHYLNIGIEEIGEVLLAKWDNQFTESKILINGKKFEPVLTDHHENHIGTITPIYGGDCLIICADGGSEDGSTKFYHRDANGQIRLIADYDNEVITGKFYGTITQMIINPNVGRAHDTEPGKTMGLTALGKYSKKHYDLIDAHWEELNKLHQEGVESLNKLFQLSNDYSKPWEDKDRCDLAFTAQQYWENRFIELIKKHSSVSKNIALVGGCALNVLLNSKVQDLGIFNQVITTPISSDSGQSLGAIMFRYPKLKCTYPFLGRGFGDTDKVPDGLLEDLISEKIVAWYQGRSEIGPRALGHRSFIALPNSLEMKNKLSVDVKRREMYRPVAPMVTEEDVNVYFNETYPSPYMTYSPTVKEITKEKAPAIVHFDNTSRVQTVSKTDNPIMHKILKMVENETGVPILMNSSLNVAGEPIVDSIEDAFRNFHNSQADVLYVNGRRYVK